VNEIAKALKQAVDSAPSGERVVTIHLFGIDNANLLDGLNVHDLADKAGIGRSYGTELRKGVRLAQFVSRK
jgi:hypothetical protein